MANLDLLMRSLSYIENNLERDMQTEEIAKACYASKSALEKTFKISTSFSVHDYIVRRRMTKAARLISQKPTMSLLDIAVNFGYSSNEAFTRAFNSVWKCNPSEFKKNYGTRKKIPELFPQITGLLKTDQENHMRRTIDISEMYDLFKERQNCYFVCADVYHLIPINQISMKAGDMALALTMKRLMDCSGDEDVAFRIGKDEFALLTCSEDIKYAEEIRDRIVALNGQPFEFESQQVPLKLYVAITKVEESALKYEELFNKLQKAIKDEKVNVDSAE